MTLLEKDIEIPVCNWAKKHGFLTPKVKFAEAGWPDRLFISPIGHTIFIEFKRPPFKPDRLQEYRLAQLRQRGIPAYWVDSIIEGINILKAAVEPARLPEPGDSVVAFPSRSGSVLGSGTGQDEHMPSGREVTIEEMFGQKNPDRGPAPSNVLRLAGGNPEVGGVRRDDVCDPPRETEGSNACE